MNKYRNYIYLAICEVSFEYFKKTKYSTYTNFCKGIRTSIEEDNLSTPEMKCLVKISEMLEKIYGMDEEMAGRYISDYFQLGDYILFETTVRAFSVIPKMGDY